MNKTPAAPTTPVLRNLPLQGDAHVLAFAGPAAPPSAQSMPMQEPARPALVKPLARESAATPSFAPAPPPAVHATEVSEQRYRDGLRVGREQGVEQGYAKARKELQVGLDAAEAERVQGTAAVRETLAQLHAAAKRLDALAAAVEAAAQSQLSQTEDDQVALCFDVIARVFGDAAVQPELLLALVREAARQMRQRSLTAIHVHPDDLALLRELPGALARLETQWQPVSGASDAAPAREMADVPAREAAVSGVDWVPDADVRLGGCIVASANGGLDARLEVTLEALRATLLQVRATRVAASAEVA